MSLVPRGSFRSALRLPTSIAVRPEDLKNRSLHVDASRFTSITEAGTGVSVWTDLSGNGNNFTQGTDANRPTFSASGLNGRPTVQFTSANDDNLIAVDDNTLDLDASGGSLYLVASPQAFDNQGSSWNLVLSKGLLGDYGFGFTASVKVRAMPGGITINYASSGLNVEGVHSYTMLSTVAATAYFDGRFAGSGTPTATDSANNLVMGGDSLGALRYAGCKISELIIFNTVHDQATRQAIEAHLINKWAMKR